MYNKPWCNYRSLSASRHQAAPIFRRYKTACERERKISRRIREQPAIKPSDAEQIRGKNIRRRLTVVETFNGATREVQSMKYVKESIGHKAAYNRPGPHIVPRTMPNCAWNTNATLTKSGDSTRSVL